MVNNAVSHVTVVTMDHGDSGVDVFIDSHILSPTESELIRRHGKTCQLRSFVIGRLQGFNLHSFQRTRHGDPMSV